LVALLYSLKSLGLVSVEFQLEKRDISTTPTPTHMDDKLMGGMPPEPPFAPPVPKKDENESLIIQRIEQQGKTTLEGVNNGMEAVMDSIRLLPSEVVNALDKVGRP
jgi:hypothetical protein